MQVAKQGNHCLFLAISRCSMPILNNQVSPSAIAFIDTQLENYQSLIAWVKSGTEVVVLDGNKDAIDQITEILGARSNIDSIHIISHGSPGSLQLGDGSLSLDDIECDRDSLQQGFSPQTASLGKIGWSFAPESLCVLLQPFLRLPISSLRFAQHLNSFCHFEGFPTTSHSLCFSHLYFKSLSTFFCGNHLNSSYRELVSSPKTSDFAKQQNDWQQDFNN